MLSLMGNAMALKWVLQRVDVKAIWLDFWSVLTMVSRMVFVINSMMEWHLL